MKDHRFAILGPCRTRTSLGKSEFILARTKHNCRGQSVLPEAQGVKAGDSRFCTVIISRASMDVCYALIYSLQCAV